MNTISVYLFRRAVILSFLAVFLSASGAVHSKVEVVEFANASEQKLYKRLVEELRCLVCQNQNLADSNADLALDLRRKVRLLIGEGKNYDDIVEYMVSRYGAFVMYRPPFDRTTLFLWLSPAVLLIASFIVLVMRRRKRQKVAVPASDFDSSEHERIRALLDQDH